ncbi:SIR2 family protein [Microbacterium sp.]|uniref:SIR2 family protein n=1 Tax=Microbacterium sp. TaxID=51671 RepID=UPI0025E3CB1E|nr:SIR2 family protein [Microbacterium sp.]MBT9608030.1 SIR2 family protein [Microbacterium sp.]
MWITGDVDLPDEILDAYETGTLVFFVGAGASLGKPSNLPLFDGLARRLARLASHRFSKRGGLDFFVGQLEALPQGFDAHHHAHSLISNPKSKFNGLHHAIVNLAGLGGAFRIVTTNYDDHLASAASSAAITVPDTWYAPALPVGRNFAGLVHLHGSIRRPKEEMILTDRDFGHAYITDAWAARFLLPMFDQFTVVFIGYSHDDVIMRYLALGLPSSASATESRRYAFTSSPGDAKWEYLGIRPIAYTAVGRDHSALVSALDAWADRARMGQTDHQARVRDIVAGGTGLPLPERDYLRSRLRYTAGARDFALATESLADEAKLAWLWWIEDLPEFVALFSFSDLTDASAILGGWFVRTFVASTTLNGAALRTVQRMGQEMATSLHQNATWRANDLVAEDERAGNRWQAILATSIHGQSAPLKADSLIPFLPEATARSVAALRAVLRPFLKLERSWYGATDAGTVAPDANVTWNAEEYALTSHLKLAVGASPAGDRSLLGALEEAVTAAYDLLDAYHGRRRWDPLAFHRSAIEPHEQDEFREPLDAVIDALRDYGTKAISVWPELPNRWWSLDRALMRRLALNLLDGDPLRTADQKLSWLLEHTALYTDHLKHEVFRVLAGALPAASDRIKQLVLEAALLGPDLQEAIADIDGHAAYAKYNLLAWLAKSVPDWGEVRAAFNATQQAHPGFEVREHPDFDSWASSTSWSSESSTDIDSFLQRLAQDAAGALDTLLSVDYSQRRFDQPEWRDSLALVKQAAERRPQFGVRLWDVLIARAELEERQRELWRAIIEGWGAADLNDTGLAVIERLTALLVDAGSAYALGRFLLDQIRKKIDDADSPVIAAMRVLAAALWREQSSGFSHSGDLSPLASAPLYLNSWPGFLAQYWGNEVDRRWRSSRDAWTGLSDEESGALAALLNGNDDALDATQPAIAGELFFYFAADPDFATAHLLPIFNDPERHTFAWYSFLHHPRWNDRILRAGLLEGLIAEFGRLEELPDQNPRHMFLGMVTSVVSYAGITAADRRRILDQTVLASGGTLATDFGQAVNRFVRQDGVNGGEVWRQWLGRHLQRRLDGQPRIASAEELARWADVVPFVGDHVPEAVELFGGRGIGLGAHMVSRDLPENALISYGAHLVGFYADRVRNTPHDDYMLRYRVGKLVAAIRGAVGEVVARPLTEIATERGFLDSA